ncbi:ABC transporter substrate-binding protein [Chitinophagaceae bacterium MMS25-I14]
MIFTFLVLAAAPHAEAQFWKSWFKKEQPKKKPVRKPVPQKTTATQPKPKTKKDQHIDYPVSRMKTRYRIDVLVPLYLDELVKNNKLTFKEKMPDKAVPGVNFYEGIRLAADTLDKWNYKIDLYVHDVSDPQQTPEQLIGKKTLDSSDLIIGAIPTAQVTPVAKFAAAHRINFVSALSPSDGGVKDNPYFTLLQPSLQTHCEFLRSYIRKKHPGKNIVVYDHSSVAADKTALGHLDMADKSVRKINCSSLPVKEQLQKAFDSTDVNVILMPVLDNAYAESLLSQLYRFFPNYRFEVYGMPSWRSLPGLKKADAYPNVMVYFTAPYYFDYTTSSGQALLSAYKREFGGRAGEYVFRGYEVFYWYAYLLNRYGTIFNTHYSDNGSAQFTRYDVKPAWSSGNDLLYNENNHVYLYRYQSGSFMVEQ